MGSFCKDKEEEMYFIGKLGCLLSDKPWVLLGRHYCIASDQAPHLLNHHVLICKTVDNKANPTTWVEV